MFIHFGLYSHLGGVWDGQPVKSGYSEQIQSFAGIFGDWYASVAQEFNPEKFDAREITALAKQAGMRSIVFTSKHHDGFCMFDTATTDYDSVEATPAGRIMLRKSQMPALKRESDSDYISRLSTGIILMPILFPAITQIS